ncbi:hypothetical protein GCM10027589_26810 [Actinocorallia lasiicapitis]
MFTLGSAFPLAAAPLTPVTEASRTPPTSALTQAADFMISPGLEHRNRSPGDDSTVPNPSTRPQQDLVVSLSDQPI